MNVDDSRALRIGMTDMAKEIGDPRVSRTIAVGVIDFDENLDNAKGVLSAGLKDKYLEINIDGYPAGT